MTPPHGPPPYDEALGQIFGQHPPTYPPRSQQRWPGYDEPPAHTWDSIGNIRERLATLESEYRHAVEAAQAAATHQHEAMGMIANRQQSGIARLHAVDLRLQAIEAQVGRNVKAIAENTPLIEQYKRTLERRRMVKGAVTWIVTAVTLYAAIAANKNSMFDALHALARTFGVQ